MTQRVFIYTRISQDRGAEGLGIQRQEEACREYAARNDMDVMEVFSDNATSAFSGRARPAYAAMLDRLRSREADAVLCWRMDRLHRRPIELEEYADICQGKRADKPILTYAVTAGGEIDLSTADGLLRAGIMGQVARFESATKRDRARAKAQQLASEGRWTGGRRPFGWDVVDGRLVLNPREAEALAAAHEDVLAGRSLGAIIAQWNDQGWDGQPLLTTAALPWAYAQLRQALLRPRNAGLYEFRGEILSRDQIPPIVSESVWRAVKTILEMPERRRSQSNKAAHLLSGIALCHCGEAVRSATVYGRADPVTGDKQKHTVYRCPAKGSGHVGKREEFVDLVVEMWAFRSMAQAYRAEPESSVSRAERTSITAELEALHVREQEAGGLLASGVLAASQMREFNETIQRRRSELEERMAQFGFDQAASLDPVAKLDREILTVEQRFNAWLALPIDDRRDYIRSRFHVVLHPHTEGSARVFDPDTVCVYVKPAGDSRRVLTSEDIAAMGRVSLGPGLRQWFESFRASRRGSVYDRQIKNRESFEKLLQQHPGLAQLIERRRKERRDSGANA
ncbi:DNA invertase Pin-like site-specific DNA recombinase [Arthrobacter sp. PvP023]|uniref:recombinase family protein n=1 Tax=Micrococcaceae TaxID=1268 RepID=UPI001AE99AA5|nr:recombinase family protein [Arthrobacter sp. PvP023]MBP1135645.1 DNA invertase Pin-like site-specific DNA recombinase [Arthrobacter sp. PvP023]